jgi:lipopolysaccharide/colanic/teichoic acid biosynthesis glycosyltransferase
MYISYVKRVFDILLLLIALILFSWLFVLILILYAVTFQFPIFFFQERIGKDQKPFRLVKFRSLINSSQPLEKRRFWLGDFLRFFSLDELPQIWNVWKGEMSFIGPRPLPTEYLPLMSAEQEARHQLLPGITGWAQVNGRHSLSWKQKFELDNFYVKNSSLQLDLLIFFKTLLLLLSLKKDSSLQEEKFTGNQ